MIYGQTRLNTEVYNYGEIESRFPHLPFVPSVFPELRVSGEEKEVALGVRRSTCTETSIVALTATWSTILQEWCGSLKHTSADSRWCSVNLAGFSSMVPVYHNLTCVNLIRTVCEQLAVSELPRAGQNKSYSTSVGTDFEDCVPCGTFMQAPVGVFSSLP